MDIKKTKEVLDKALHFIVSEEFSDKEKKQIEKDAVNNFNKYVNPGWLKYRKSVSTNEAFIEWKDYDSYFTDLYGEEFIDCLGGFGIFTFGHRNPEILKFVQAQLNHQALHSQELLDPLRGYLAQAMSAITPGDLQYCFFTNGGAEAVEMALKLARIASKKQWIISTVNGFHGKSMGALSVGGKDTYRIPYLPLIQQVSHVIYGDIDDMKKTLWKLSKVGEKVAAVILEPVQGEAGIIVPPKGYLKEVRRLCDEYGILLIFDEIQCGMGRTGSYFRCEAEGVVPDIMAYGKAFGGGIMPITGIIARPKLWVKEIQDNPWILGSATFSGNPIACSAALGAINFMVKHNVPKLAREKGNYLMSGLRKLQKAYSKIIVDVRGVGLMIGVEFPKSEIGYFIAKGLFAKKVMTA
ncbi:MAG: aminotransferase class III-fold pyridoxal phosphate-dependent enzyme, partial [Elusimicrobiota bacterium]|nr:aminotransferase class III-fold pyridoxal phosphate-dependent enzyme [Elusimicrobiota bacterium]